MTLSFLALSVIPALKITDRGLVDVDRFEIVPLVRELGRDERVEAEAGDARGAADRVDLGDPPVADRERQHRDRASALGGDEPGGPVDDDGVRRAPGSVGSARCSPRPGRPG